MENPKRRRTPVDQSRPILYIGCDGQPHNHVEKFIRYLKRRRSLGNRDRHFKISHDDWCAFFKDGVCNCDPDIREMLPWEIVGS